MVPPKPSASASRYRVRRARSSSIRPSQSLSSPSQTSVTAGLTAALASSQSPGTSTYPAGAEQARTVSAPPYPSPSASRKKVDRRNSSISPSQLLSFPSQTSSAPGWIPGSASSQSPGTSTYPAGAEQAWTVSAPPKPSPSASR